MTTLTRLSRLMLLIVDEVSMVGSNMLLEIHKRLQQIKGVPDDAVFGGESWEICISYHLLAKLHCLAL